MTSPYVSEQFIIDSVVDEIIPEIVPIDNIEIDEKQFFNRFADLTDEELAEFTSVYINRNPPKPKRKRPKKLVIEKLPTPPKEPTPPPTPPPVQSPTKREKIFTIEKDGDP